MVLGYIFFRETPNEWKNSPKKWKNSKQIKNKFGCGKHKQRMIAFKECGSKRCNIFDKLPQSHPNIYYWQPDALIWNATSKRWNLSWQKMIARKKSMCNKKCMQPISARYKRSTNRLSQSWFKSSRWTNVVFSIYMQFCVNILRIVCIVNSRISFMRDIITCNSRISILWDADCDMYIRSSLFFRFVVFLPYTKIGHALYKWEQLLGTQE